MTSQQSSLGHLPGTKWEFDSSVTHVFEDMLQRSIPNYLEMRQLTRAIAKRFHQPETYVVDLGCSLGSAIAELVEELSADARFLGCEVSEPMRTEATRRFGKLIDSGKVTISDTDLRTDYPDVSASVTLCVLTLMFVPMEYRQRIVQDAWAQTVPGGVFLMVEKILGDNAVVDELLTGMYLDWKASQGYSQEEIDRKRLALEGVQVPITANWNDQLLRRAGFQHVDCYWRSGKFAGWLAIK